MEFFSCSIFDTFKAVSYGSHVVVGHMLSSATNLVHSPSCELKVRMDEHDREGVSSQVAVELDGSLIAQALGGGRGPGIDY